MHAFSSLRPALVPLPLSLPLVAGDGEVKALKGAGGESALHCTHAGRCMHARQEEKNIGWGRPRLFSTAGAKRETGLQISVVVGSMMMVVKLGIRAVCP